MLHPARPSDSDEPVPWAAVAHECGTTLHPQAQFWRLARRRTPYGYATGWPGDTVEGLLPRAEVEALTHVLGRHTTTAERTIVAFWVGYSLWPGAWMSLPTAPGPVRESYLFERPLRDVARLCAEAPAVCRALGETGDVGWSGSDGTVAEPSAEEQLLMFGEQEWQSPSAWWPADQAWATSNDTDMDSTLVGGSRALVDDLVADDRLEVLQWPLDGSLWQDADTVNR